MSDVLERSARAGREGMRAQVMPGVHVETHVGGRPKRPRPEDLADPGYDNWLKDKLLRAFASDTGGRRYGVEELRREFGNGR